MAKPTKKHQRALAVRPDSLPYEVGYGKPPAETRFKPGRSGNPKGRPKGARNKRPALHEERMKEILLDEAYRTIKVNDGAGQISVPMAQAIIRSLAVNAAKGNQRAQRLFTELLFTTERENKRLHDEWLDVAMTYKVEWDRELARRERLGIEGPQPLPHPDHVVINMRSGEVQINGPATKEEKADYDMLCERKAAVEEERDELKRILRDEPDYPHRDQVKADLEYTEHILELARKIVPD
jgi:hypothetical protein